MKVNYSDSLQHKAVELSMAAGVIYSLYRAYEGWTTESYDVCIGALIPAAVLGLGIMNSLKLSIELERQQGENRYLRSRITPLSLEKPIKKMTLVKTPVETPVGTPVSLLNEAWFKSK